MKDLVENPEVPVEYALDFSIVMNARGYLFDFSIRSLIEDFDRAFCEKKDVVLKNFDFETGMSCYLGEVLKNEFNGVWKGHCSEKSALNYYTSSMHFGEYEFRPFIYVGYRCSNGVNDTGSMKTFLGKLVPSLEARQNLKKNQAKLAREQGKIFLDNDPWV